MTAAGSTGQSLPPLAASAANVTSQGGEDGILAEVFRRIGPRSRFAVELGAWDGRQYSNAWSLWHDQGWSAVLIEGDPERHAALAAALAGRPGVRAANVFVAASGERSLDAVLAREGVPAEFDLLSLDIDGDDHHVWSSLEGHRPRVAVVEYNPTIPPHVDLAQPLGARWGCSARALVGLAHRMGYRLAALTPTNGVFVAEADFPALRVEEPVLETVFPRDHLTYLVTTFDGEGFLDRRPPFVHRVKPLKRLYLGDPPHAEHPMGAELGWLPVHVHSTRP